jgi:type IV secretion system protein TrbF
MTNDLMNTEPNPYIEGRKEWTERYGSYIAQAANWRYAAMGSIVTAIILAGGMVTLASKSRFVPYVVEVDKLGALQAVAPADRMAEPSSLMVKTSLKEFMEDTRLISTDSTVQIKAIKRVYGKIPNNSASKNFIDQFYKDQDPLKTAETKTIDPEVTLVLPLSDKSWQVEWKESVHDKSGNLLEVTRWKATLTIDFNPPATVDALTINPLGLFVTNLSWAKQL